VGIAAAVWAFLGKITTIEQLASATLGVLAVIAISMVIERERRLKDRNRTRKILEEIQRTGDAVEVFASPTPYHVLVNESVWEIEANGDAKARRLKKLRFTQDDVITVTDWYRGDGSLSDTQYLVGEPPNLRPTEVVHTFPSRGRACALIALDRAYMRDEVRDYVVQRSGKAIFPKNPDRIWVAVLESTSLVRVVLRWSGRLPTEVRLIRQMDMAPGRPVKFVPNTLADGRSEFRAEIPEPRQGERIGVEWDWPHEDDQEETEDPGVSEELAAIARKDGSSDI